DLAGHPADPLVWRPPQDDPGADAGRQQDVDELVDAARHAEDLLAQRADVGVVLQLDVDAEARLHLRGRLDATPAGQDAVGDEPAGRPVDRRRDAEPDAEDPLRLDTG